MRKACNACSWPPNHATATQGTVVEVQLRGADGQPVEVDLNCTLDATVRGARWERVLVGRHQGISNAHHRQLRGTQVSASATVCAVNWLKRWRPWATWWPGWRTTSSTTPSLFVFGNMHCCSAYGAAAQYLDAVHARWNCNRCAAAAPATAHRQPAGRPPSLVEGTLEGAQRTNFIVAGLKRFAAVAPEEIALWNSTPWSNVAIHWVAPKGTAPGFLVRWQRADDCWVQGSEGRLLRVMMNLIQNAYDAATSVPNNTPALDITLQRDAQQVRLVFADNGTGIAPEHLGRIFDPFFTTKKGGGHRAGPVHQLRFGGANTAAP